MNHPRFPKPYRRIRIRAIFDLAALTLISLTPGYPTHP
jgi:hypothetical protein